MQRKYILLAALTIALISIVVADYQYGDKTCDLSQLAPGKPLWICYNPDGGMDHGFLTFPLMHDYYTGQGYEEILDPPQTYIYIEGAPSGTYTFSP